ncbi:hypothetical protein SCHPADRAFT_824099, partial [Schizopora paradoxa]
MQERPTATHARWAESILAHNIVDVQHRPGIENPAADAISQMWQNRLHFLGDGSDWSVVPDWEARDKSAHPIFLVTPSEDEISPHPLEIRFTNDSFFMPIVLYLLGKPAGASVRERKRSKHRAESFFIQDDKLFKLNSRGTDRCPSVECVPSSEGFEIALREHQSKGHFGRDLLRLHLHDRFFWPGM